MMKRVCAIAVSALLAVLITGCAGSGSTSTEASSGGASTSEAVSSASATTSSTSAASQDDGVDRSGHPITGGEVPDNSVMATHYVEGKKGAMVFQVPSFYGVQQKDDPGSDGTFTMEEWNNLFAEDLTVLYAASGDQMNMVRFHVIEPGGVVPYDDFTQNYNQILDWKNEQLMKMDSTSNLVRTSDKAFELNNGMDAAFDTYTFEAYDHTVSGITVMINNSKKNYFVFVDMWQADTATSDFSVEFEKMIMGAEVEQ